MIETAPFLNRVSIYPLYIYNIYHLSERESEREKKLFILNYYKTLELLKHVKIANQVICLVLDNSVSSLS